MSPPARGAWIEIRAGRNMRRRPPRSPPARGAWIEIQNSFGGAWSVYGRPPHGGRGLKSLSPRTAHYGKGSPPARGAWIEISHPCSPCCKSLSRPPHGGRGLKFPGGKRTIPAQTSPPARGAWIEIIHRPRRTGVTSVAPRTGGVD